MDCTKTLKLRIKDKHAKLLSAMAREVNQVWNYCNETSHRAIQERHKWLSGFDLQKLTNGFSKCEGVRIGSATVQQVCEEYATRRKQFKKNRLNWRVSNPKSSKRSLGWIPFKARAIQYKSGQIVFAGQKLCLWDSYGLKDYELRAGSFSEDSRGRWYLNVVVKVPELVGSTLPGGTTALGIDLGMKEAAVCSNGQRIEGRWYRQEEKRLAVAQRARRKDRARAISAKIANRRKDDLHKLSTSLVKSNAAIFVGNVSSKAMVKTKNAKSTLDAGWSMFKTMLEYKCHQAGIVFEVVNEAYTTQTCSCCGTIPDSSPKGQKDQDVRAWTCSNCGAEHDRDINAAMNICAVGLASLAISAAAEEKSCETAVNEIEQSVEAGHGLPVEGIPAL